MPVQYTSIMDEHLAVRNAAGLFDISHMGEFLVEGEAAPEFLNAVLTNDIRKLQPGQGQYTLLCNEKAGVIDDLYAYRLRSNEYLLIVNASGVDKDFEWLERLHQPLLRRADVKLRNVSAQTGAVAVQGPKVAEFIDRCFPGASLGGTSVGKPTELQKNQIALWSWSGKDIWVSRTGYTGEDGFEIVAPAQVITEIWDKLLAEGKAHGIKPAGLGARDTLRTEVCYPLYGHELDENTTPIEAGLGFFVALEKGDFLGHGVMARQKAEGVSKKLVAFKMVDKSAPPRPHYPIWSSGPEAARVGEVASGTQSPSLGIGIGLGYVPAAIAKPHTPIDIEIRGRRAAAVIVPKPIFRKAEIKKT